MDKVQRLEGEFGDLLVFLELVGEGPLGGIYGLVIGLPEIVHDFEVDHGGFVEDGGTVVLVIGYKIEVGADGG